MLTRSVTNKRMVKPFARLLRGYASGGDPLPEWSQIMRAQWQAFAAFEQSLLDPERRGANLFSPSCLPLSPTFLSRAAQEGESEFFSRLAASPSVVASNGQGTDLDELQELVEDMPPSSFASYSMNCSVVSDADGQCVASSKRRHYEDALGRLMATRERKVGGAKLTTTWSQSSANDSNPQCHTVLDGCASATDFEAKWARTPFGHAEDEQHRATAEAGPDKAAGRAAPSKEGSELGHGFSDEAKRKSREQMIAEAAQQQLEETTPPPSGHA